MFMILAMQGIEYLKKKSKVLALFIVSNRFKVQHLLNDSRLATCQVYKSMLGNIIIPNEEIRTPNLGMAGILRTLQPIISDLTRIEGHLCLGGQSGSNSFSSNAHPFTDTVCFHGLFSILTHLGFTFSLLLNVFSINGLYWFPQYTLFKKKCICQ